jgi:hypothetical protein
VKIRPRHVVVLGALVPYVALGWLVGLIILVVALLRAFRRFQRMRRALAPTAACPWCREDVPQYGAYGCQSCRARTLGWVWRCVACDAWAGHIECPNPECGLSIGNPLLPRP